MIFLGKVTKRRGNRGEIVCKTSPDITVADIDFSSPFILKSEKHEKQFFVEFFKEQEFSIILKFSKVDSINESLKLIGYNVFCKSQGTKQKEQDLKGFTVVDVRGDFWGKVESMEKGKFTSTLNVIEGDNLYLIPFNDKIIVEINMKNKLLLIDPPDGLKDLNKK